MLYTTEQIAQIYSGEENNVTPYMITHTWITRGLKHIKGKGKGFLFKKIWVDEYLENQAIIKETKSNQRIRKSRQKTRNNSCQVH